MLPTFLIIGTMKGGTTSLYNYLRGHPQVFMSPTKELHYFVAEKNLSRGTAWYERNFRSAGDAAAVGEASPDYTKYPIYDGVPGRIAHTVPGVKLLYVIRNPLDRIRSHYLHDVARGRERRSIDDAVPASAHYLAPSRYSLQIERYLEHFPREQLLVITSEALRGDRRATMGRVHDFIGVDADWSAPVQEQEFNAIAAKTAPGTLLLAARHLPGASRLRLLAPGPVMAAERLLRATRRPVDVRAGTMSEDLRQRLIDELAPDLASLRGHMEEGFDAWGLC
jgi:hypothetical protein